MSRLATITELSSDSVQNASPITRLIGTRFFQQSFIRDASPQQSNAITAASLGADTFTIIGDFTERYPVDSTFSVSGSTANDVQLAVVTAVVFSGGDTVITTSFDVVDSTGDGTIVPTTHTLTMQGVMGDVNKSIQDTAAALDTVLNTASTTNTLTSITLDVLEQTGLTNPPNNVGAGVREFKIRNIYDVTENTLNAAESFIRVWEDRQSTKPEEYLINDTVANILAAANG